MVLTILLQTDQKHHSETFDPYAIPKIGNYGIDYIRNAAHDLLKNYYNKSAAQVDLIAHSMGGLIPKILIMKECNFSQNPY
jgi:hypothetical protein